MLSLVRFIGRIVATRADTYQYLTKLTIQISYVRAAVAVHRTKCNNIKPNSKAQKYNNIA